MRAFLFANIRRLARPLVGSLAIVMALALMSTMIVRPATASGGAQDAVPETTQAAFPGTGTGAIPDGLTGTPPQYGAPLVISFAATGMTAPLSAVTIDVNITHSWVGDVDMVLAAPGGAPSLVLAGHVGVQTAGSFGDSSNYGGIYTFSDAAAGTNIWTVATAGACGDACVVTVGSYRTTARGVTGQTNPPPVTSLNTTFAGLTTPQINGTWTLTVRDGAAADTGSVSAATLNLTGGGLLQHIVDYDGDGKTDPSVVRNTGGGPSGQITWFNRLSGGVPASTTTPWGIATDFFVPEDYDGDLKTDIAVWRPGAPFNSFFYILQSQTGTLRTDTFGQSGDDPTVIGDYDGDNKSDPAVYRAGAAAGDHSFWYYRSSVNGLIIGTEWGQNGDFPAPGDFDGDGKFDFVVQRNGGGGQARFFQRLATGAQSSFIFGTPTDVVCPGDYDGDGKYDIATIRGSGGQILWNILNSNGGTTTSVVWGTSATDFGTQGDYDGDGKTDICVWRPNADPTLNFFYIRGSGGVQSQVEWGQNGDYPVANYNSH